MCCRIKRKEHINEESENLQISLGGAELWYAVPGERELFEPDHGLARNQPDAGGNYGRDDRGYGCDHERRTE